MKSSFTDFKRIIKAFSYSQQGLQGAFETEVAFRQDLVICAILSLVALFCPFDITQKMILLFSHVLILLMELTNTAIEVAIDRIGQEYHLLSKKAKDIGSSLVLLSFFLTILLWVMAIYSIL